MTFCRYCHRPIATPYTSVRAYCDYCWQMITICRIALHKLVIEKYLVQISDSAWLIMPGAQEIAQLVYDVADQFEDVRPVPVAV